MFDCVMKIITKWDPIGIAKISKDEYTIEAHEIVEIINNSNFLNKKDFANEIDKIFLKWFGEDVYDLENSKSEEIAQQIVDCCIANIKGKPV